MIHRFPYWIRLFSFTYTAAVLPGAVVAVLADLYQFRPGVFESKQSDDRFADLGSSLVLAIITALILPRTPGRYRLAISVGLAFLATLWSWYMHWKGWLIYHHWNGFFMLLRHLVVLYLLVAWYDRWATNYMVKRELARTSAF